ncbi:hypothetical protein LB518_16410 [Mesorhizobium sp. BR1-1-16]|uniref:hypothetical protein n=1 Tax=Mesorhizobium sp. BR1-1-16 TaxID=2876653 RepID=UPI001CCD01A5|nr:hypothetical protein [Mesorhizobium sp. BR1-1-16]MBZ9937884.1 hypothetical protein [Mesorhizobium sp. BR1-1-16]
METAVVMVLLAIQIAYISLSVSRFGFAPFPTLAVVYLFVAQISLIAVKWEILEYPFLQYYTRGGYITYFMPVISVYFAISSAVMAIFAKDMRTHQSTKFAAQQIDVRQIDRLLPAVNFGFGVFMVIYVFIMVLILDWSIVWSNSVYLLMTRPNDVVTVSGVGFLLSLMPFAAILAAVLAAINISLSRTAWGIFFGVVALMGTFYYIGAHQRVALLPPVAFFVVLSVVGRRTHLFLRSLSAVLAVFSLTSALAGRGSGTHGISTIFDAFVRAVGSDLLDTASSLMLNLTEGIFVVAESLVGEPVYPLLYKILSFSPLPSVIDNFQSISRVSQVRITRYVPYSGYVELYNFGIVFLLAFVLFFWISIRIYKNVLKRNQYIGLACGFLILLGLIQLFAYPLRNGLKPLWIADIVGVGALLYYRGRKTAEPQQATLDPGLQRALVRRDVPLPTRPLPAGPLSAAHRGASLPRRRI